MNIIKKSTELTKSPIFAILSCLLCILAGYSIKSSLIEIFASVMGIINVWLLSKEKISNFIFGIITVLAYLYIYYTTGLYALAILACFQVIFNIYGWYYWGKGDDGNSTKTSGLNRQGQLLWIAIILLGCMGLCGNQYPACSECHPGQSDSYPWLYRSILAEQKAV